ncbi:MAG: TonB-dependent receptor [Dysgonamonadaceae bacterium]|nr:TonB-dependent receptor [Dysgonamonadaceae bacterium]
MVKLLFFRRNRSRFLRFSFLFLLLLWGGNSVVSAQQQQVSGIVLSSENDEPVAGATIAVDGASVGTVSGIDGKFTLSNIPSGGNRLTISFLGYQTRAVSFKTGEHITVVLEPETSLLDEVIVVAYGTSTRRQFTGSASVVNAASIGKLQTSSVTNALEGRATGVQIVSSTGQPGENPNVRIRGIGSINAAKNPLYIVDGATYDGPVSALNSADIENLTVLKDAAANSLYGARGANGVILITTKRGNTNETKISFDAKWGVNSRAVPEYDFITDRATYYEQAWKGQFNKLYDNYTTRANNPLSSDAAAAQAREDIAGNGTNSLQTILGGYNNYDVPWANLLDGNGKLNPNARLLYQDDWHDALFRNSLRQEYNLNITGGNDKQNYYVGFGYLNDESYAKGSGFDRYTGRIRGEKELAKWLKGGVNLSYAHTIQNYPLTSGASYVNYFQWTRHIAPIYPVYLRDPATGETIKDKDGKAIYDYGDSNDLGYTRPYAARANPAGVLDYDVNRNTLDNVIGSTFLEAQLYDGLSLKGAFDVNTTYKNGAFLTNPTYGDGVSYNGIIEQELQRYFSYTGSVFLNYNKTFGKWHVDFLGGAESYRKERHYLYGAKSQLATSYEPELSNAVAFRDLTSYLQKYGVVGYLTRLNLSYGDKYYLSGSFRRDASSRFAPENRWGNFGSVGASWRISEENFLRDVDFVDNLKLKGSVGSQGNDNLLYDDGSTINYIPYADHYEVVNNNGSVSVRQTYVGNRDISWEKSLNLNAGIEARVADRVNFGFEYFSKTTSDLLFYKPIHLSSGIGSLPVNLGKIKNAGIEFEIDADIVKTRSFVWNIGLNLSKVKNTILSLPEENRENGIFATGYTKLVEGGSLYDLYLPDFAGIDETGKNTWNIYDADGNFKETTTVYNNAYTDLSRRNQGSAVPDLTGGFSTSITYKGIDLSAVFSYQSGGKVYDAIYAASLQMTDYGRSYHKDILNAWTPENTNTTVPRLVSGYTDASRASSLYITDASYLNIRNVSIGYTFSKSVLKTLGINTLRIFAAGDNLAFFSKKQGLDPRQYDYGSTGFNYSPIRTISFGLNVTL